MSVEGTTAIDYEAMISARARAIDVSGIRRVFELGAKLKNPINFSIGQPDFAVPEPIKQAAIAAISRKLPQALLCKNFTGHLMPSPNCWP